MPGTSRATYRPIERFAFVDLGTSVLNDYYKCPESYIIEAFQVDLLDSFPIVASITMNIENLIIFPYSKDDQYPRLYVRNPIHTIAQHLLFRDQITNFSINQVATTPMSVRPFSPSESFAYPKPPEPVAGSVAGNSSRPTSHDFSHVLATYRTASPGGGGRLHTSTFSTNI